MRDIYVPRPLHINATTAWKEPSPAFGKKEERLEFGEGDIGLPGGTHVIEPSNANPTTVDVIRRFGRSTSLPCLGRQDQQV